MRSGKLVRRFVGGGDRTLPYPEEKVEDEEQVFEAHRQPVVPLVLRDRHRLSTGLYLQLLPPSLQHHKNGTFQSFPPSEEHQSVDPKEPMNRPDELCWEPEKWEYSAFAGYSLDHNLDFASPLKHLQIRLAGGERGV